MLSVFIPFHVCLKYVQELPQLNRNIAVYSFKLKQNSKQKVLGKQKSKECQGKNNSIYPQARHLFKLCMYVYIVHKIKSCQT